MAKSSKDAHNAKGRGATLLFDPADLVLVDDKGSAIFDERIFDAPEESMVLNIMAYGVIEPIVVRKNPETGKTEVVAGRGRVLATREANKRLKKKGEEPIWVPAVVRRGEPHVLMGVMVSENVHRRAETPLQKAQKVARFLDLGRSEEEAAIMMGVSTTTIKNMVRLLDAPKEVKKAVENGTIAASDGYKLAKLDAGEAKKRLADLPPPGDHTREKKPRAAARKARAENREALGLTDGMRGKKEVQAKLEEVQGAEAIKENHRAAIEAALYWVLGDEKPLVSLIG
jgi:ParB family chromosome partitioning protein